MTRTTYSYLFLVFIICFSCQPKAPTAFDIKIPTASSFRAVAFDQNGTIWAAGSGGALFKGKETGNWERISAPNDSLDYRCISVFGTEILLASAGTPAKIFKSPDLGQTWNLVYHDTAKSAFFDAMVMDSTGNAFVLGDPENGRFQIYHSADFGTRWKKLAPALLPQAREGEVAFAASNTSMVQVKEGLIFITGGQQGANIHAGIPLEGKWKKELLPLKQGAACGGFSLVRYGENLVAGGGCYDKIRLSEGNFLFSDNMGSQWFTVPDAPEGYISGLGALNGERLFSVGDLGIQWARTKNRKFSYLVKGPKLNAIACNSEGCVAVGKEGACYLIRM